ncbi:CID domain [Lasallia pustulata]|uniref:CID domain n=1 Tax=Lasallia pustulata TaxID=136370 RepID=A0A1W5CW24_9LECA|nr:CID domain [Lasallia pustulata]
MASHHLAIAKASLAAAMMRPDPTPVARDGVAQLHSLLEAALEQCSSINIQLCKAWLLKNIVPSPARITAIGKYLVAYSGSIARSTGAHGRLPDQHHPPSTRRKQLHILYLLNDLLHHTRYHITSSSAYSTLTGTIQSHLVDLVGSAAAFDSKAFPKHHERIDKLLVIWEANGYYQPSYIQKLRETVINAANLGYSGAGMMELELGDTAGAQRHLSKANKDAPYVMPATHGDPSVPYYDLPAGNMMPHIIPNSTTPINAQLLKPLQFVAGPADENLVIAVKDFMKDVELLFGTEVEYDGDIAIDIDQLGQPIVHDEVSGEPKYESKEAEAIQQFQQQRQEREPWPEPEPSLVESVNNWPPRTPELAQKFSDEV